MTKKLLFLIVLTLFLYSSAAWPVEYQADGKIIIPDKVTGEITIDGKLHEAVWQIPPLDKEFMSLIPNYGNPLGLKTLVWAAYDKGSIYFAFKCFDPESKKIKSSIAQRDKIFNDDVFGVLLDASGNKQGSYEFYTNPRGIQMDSLNSAVSGVDFEPDFVWESAGRMIPEGYQGEIRIPLESIRYQRGKNKEVKMRVMFYRGVPHRGVVATWPGIETGQTEYNFMASLLYHDLKNTLKLEVLPNITYSRNSDRVNPDTWDTTTDTLEIVGNVLIEGSLDFGKANGTDTITYEVTGDDSTGFDANEPGTLYCNGNIGIRGNFAPDAGTSGYLNPGVGINSLGVVTPNDITFSGQPGNYYTGFFYAEGQVNFNKQAALAGTVIGGLVNFAQVPDIYQVPNLVSYLPKAVPGGSDVFMLQNREWRRVY